MLQGVAMKGQAGKLTHAVFQRSFLMLSEFSYKIANANSFPSKDRTKKHLKFMEFPIEIDY